MSKVRASRPCDFFDTQFPKSPTDRQLREYRNIWFRVALMWVPPRDSMFEYTLEMGRNNIVPILEHKPIDLRAETSGGGQALIFMFPERYLTTQEEQIFVTHLMSHPQIVEGKMTIVDIATKSPLMIGCFIQDDIRIIQKPDLYETGVALGTKNVERNLAKFWKDKINSVADTR